MHGQLPYDIRNHIRNARFVKTDREENGKLQFRQVFYFLTQNVSLNAIIKHKTDIKHSRY